MTRLTQGQAGWNAGLDQAIYHANMLKQAEGTSEETVATLDDLIQSCAADKTPTS